MLAVAVLLVLLLVLRALRGLRVVVASGLVGAILVTTWLLVGSSLTIPRATTAVDQNEFVWACGRKVLAEYRDLDLIRKPVV